MLSPAPAGPYALKPYVAQRANVSQTLQVQQSLLKTCGGDIWPPPPAPGKSVFERTTSNTSLTQSRGQIQMKEIAGCTSLPLLCQEHDDDSGLPFSAPTELSFQPVVLKEEKAPPLLTYGPGGGLYGPSLREWGSYGPSLRERMTGLRGLEEDLQGDSLEKLDIIVEKEAQANDQDTEEKPIERSIGRRVLAGGGREFMQEEMYAWQTIMMTPAATPEASERSEPAQDFPPTGATQSMESVSDFSQRKSITQTSFLPQRSSIRRNTKTPQDDYVWTRGFRETWTHGFSNMTRHSSTASAPLKFSVTQNSFRSDDIGKLPLLKSKGAIPRWVPKDLTRSLKVDSKGCWRKSPLRNALAATSENFHW